MNTEERTKIVYLSSAIPIVWYGSVPAGTPGSKPSLSFTEIGTDKAVGTKSAARSQYELLPGDPEYDTKRKAIEGSSLFHIMPPTIWREDKARERMVEQEQKSNPEARENAIAFLAAVSGQSEEDVQRECDEKHLLAYEIQHRAGQIRLEQKIKRTAEN